MTLSILSALITGLALSLATAASAQETGESGSETLQAEASANSLSEVVPTEGIGNDTLSDQKLDAFIRAVANIRSVSLHYRELIEAEADEERRAFLIETANKDIVKAVAAVPDMTASEYVAIDRAAQDDEVLNDRILDRVEKLKDDAKARQPLRLPEPDKAE